MVGLAYLTSDSYFFELSTFFDVTIIPELICFLENTDLTIRVNEKEYIDIIPNAAFSFLIKLYTSLTEKTTEEIQPPELKENPNAKGYERQTIAIKMKGNRLTFDH